MPIRLRLLAAALAAVSLLLPQGAGAQDRVVPPSAEALRMSYAPIVKRVVPAVVTVSAAKMVSNRNPLMEDPFFPALLRQQFGPREQTQQSLGSGVLVDPSGLIVTNNHVIDGADQVKSRSPTNANSPSMSCSRTPAPTSRCCASRTTAKSASR